MHQEWGSRIALLHVQSNRGGGITAENAELRAQIPSIDFAADQDSVVPSARDSNQLVRINGVHVGRQPETAQRTAQGLPRSQSICRSPRMLLSIALRRDDQRPLGSFCRHNFWRCRH